MSNTKSFTILSIAIVISSFIFSFSISKLKTNNHSISVTGSARKSIVSDFSVWRSKIAVERSNLPDSYQALQNQSEIVKTFFINNKIPESNIELKTISTYKVPEVLPNGRQSGKIKSFRLTQEFEIRSADINHISELSKKSMTLVNRGLDFRSFSPEFLYTKLSDLRVEMLSEATKDARKRAKVIIESAGNHLGPIISARTGVFQITRPHSTEVSDYGMYDTTSIEKDITAVMTLTFAVH